MQIWLLPKITNFSRGGKNPEEKTLQTSEAVEPRSGKLHYLKILF